MLFFVYFRHDTWVPEASLKMGIAACQTQEEMAPNVTVACQTDQICNSVAVGVACQTDQICNSVAVGVACQTDQICNSVTKTPAKKK